MSTVETSSTEDPTNNVPVALSLRGIDAGYGISPVLHDVNIDVEVGQVVALLGPNGAGKTTTMRVAAGILQPTSGSVSVNGVGMTKRPSHDRARAGLCLIPEGRGIFRSLTVAENLRLQLPSWAPSGSTIDRAVTAFPVLAKRFNQLSGKLSGGEQQMLALGRAFISSPSCVLLDEVSMGLSPLLVDEIFAALGQLSETGTALLLVEQYVNRALELADRVVLLTKGSVTFDGPPSDLDEDSLVRHYMGTDGSAAAETDPAR